MTTLPYVHEPLPLHPPRGRHSTVALTHLNLLPIERGVLASRTHSPLFGDVSTSPTPTSSPKSEDDYLSLTSLHRLLCSREVIGTSTVPTVKGSPTPVRIEREVVGPLVTPDLGLGVRPYHPSVPTVTGTTLSWTPWFISDGVRSPLSRSPPPLEGGIPNSRDTSKFV